jgi:hypothetical protein
MKGYVNLLMQRLRSFPFSNKTQRYPHFVCRHVGKLTFSYSPFYLKHIYIFRLSISYLVLARNYMIALKKPQAKATQRLEEADGMETNDQY